MKLLANIILIWFFLSFVAIGILIKLILNLKNKNKQLKAQLELISEHPSYVDNGKELNNESNI